MLMGAVSSVCVSNPVFTPSAKRQTDKIHSLAGVSQVYNHEELLRKDKGHVYVV